jgi:hypothetical protein
MGGYGPKSMSAPAFEISRLEDLEGVAAAIGLPVGPRTGPNKRTKVKKEWYIIVGFLREAIPPGAFELLIAIRNGRPIEEEPDFVVTRGGAVSVIGLVEITEATDESDQKRTDLVGAFRRTRDAARSVRRTIFERRVPAWIGLGIGHRRCHQAEGLKNPFSSLHLLLDT